MKLFALALLAGCTLIPSSVASQETMRAPDGGTTNHVDGVELLAIPGKPLSGKSSIEWTRTLEDGSTLAVQGVSILARDSQGRMYRERRTWVPAGSSKENPLIEKRYYDPVAKTQTICIERMKQCIVNDYHPRTRLIEVPAHPFAIPERSVSNESLGDSTIEDMKVVGTRETMTISAGVAGNSQPLTITREFWFSEELDTNLSVTRIDPRIGKQVVRLVDLVVGEPDAKLFELPEGYAVVDARQPQQGER
jgi:hypothetical protein